VVRGSRRVRSARDSLALLLPLLLITTTFTTDSGVRELRGIRCARAVYNVVYGSVVKLVVKVVVKLTVPRASYPSRSPAALAHVDTKI